LTGQSAYRTRIRATHARGGEYIIVKHEEKNNRGQNIFHFQILFDKKQPPRNWRPGVEKSYLGMTPQPLSGAHARTRIIL
jgi:hypothetical protein